MHTQHNNRNNSSCFLDLQNISKSFFHNSVLNNVSLSIPKNTITTIFGKSGEGKSVLLKCIIGILTADSGKIIYNGVDIRKKNRNNAHLLQDFSYLFQESALFDSLNVFDNIAFPLRERLKIKDKHFIEQKVKELLDSVHLKNINSTYPSELSGGMKKRVALARLLALTPKIMLCDEPTTGLDPITGKKITELIANKTRENNITCIIISHNINATLPFTDNVAFLENTKIVYSGNKENMFTAHNTLIRQFLDIANI